MDLACLLLIHIEYVSVCLLNGRLGLCESMGELIHPPLSYIILL